eukprot:2977332-Prorocentrum_lima.AAC.1
MKSTREQLGQVVREHQRPYCERPHTPVPGVEPAQGTADAGGWKGWSQGQPLFWAGAPAEWTRFVNEKPHWGRGPTVEG